MIGLLVDGRYRILSRIARGGMGTVYAARDERLERMVALKLMHPHLAQSADFVARFRHEARAAARIVHPSVVSIFDQGVYHGQGFLVMELVDGPNLRTLLDARGSFTLGTALRYTHEILVALAAAHRVGVVHRDVKPENVLVPKRGPVKVADFGLARAASEVSLSTTGSVLGTVAYLAPEVAATGRVDARADLYSVGIMLDEMLTGHVPWEDENPLQMAYSHVNSDVPAPSGEQPWIPRDVDALVTSLAARDPGDRPRSAEDALEEVARVRAALPLALAARRSQVTPHSPQPIRGTAPLDFQARTVALPRSSRHVVRASGAVRQQSPAPARARNRTPVILLLTLVMAVAAGGWWWWTQYGPGSYVRVPALAGRSEQSAQASLSSLGLDVGISREYSDSVQPGTVIDIDPPAGTRVHRDDSVRVRVSRGVQMRTVPDVVGATSGEALRSIEDAGLGVGSQTQQWSETVAQGSVISTYPRAGASIAHDSKVDVVVSKGPQPIAVPELVGLPRAQADSALRAAGLTGTAREDYSDSVPSGTVISQEPQAGAQVAGAGSRVTFVVSRGPETVQVPDVTGRQIDDARRILTDAGLAVEVQDGRFQLFNVVADQNPRAGESVKPGARVTLRVM